MKSREVGRRLLDLDCTLVRQNGSHERWVSPCGKCFTTVPSHGPRDIKIGTLRSIQRQMEECLGKGWLLG
ncbi:MAG: type II toxin-antitoxin system HicA family toxin [Deltaproteobacteria bacterium]|nr:type II toxin-antitoxin system HicA family toxin [Deltaproteobacteria bacterium]